MQQFKTYPGIPPNGVVERPSILRIPPFLLCTARPLRRYFASSISLPSVSSCILVGISVV